MATEHQFAELPFLSSHKFIQCLRAVQSIFLHNSLHTIQRNQQMIAFIFYWRFQVLLQ